MREIKFKYIIIREKEEMISKAFSIIDIEFGYMNRWYAANHIGADELKRCQYTGLKDKNGKEIYEGDVLQFEYDGEMHIAGAVKWREEVSIWAVDIGIGLTTIEPEDAWVPDTYEIIGNIYENPELKEATG